MADPKIKFKRSAVAGKIPTAAQVPLGELALNTNDGLLYASKDVGAGTTVIAVNPFRVGTGTDSYNTFFTAGNVGINSTIPTSKLDVDGDVKLSGVITATTFSGSGASLTNLPAANITGTLPAISGANLTNLNGSNISSGTVAAARVGALPASKVTSGTFDSARIPTLNQNTTGTAALAEGLTGSPNITVSDVNVGGGLSVTGNSFFVGIVTFAAGTDGNIVLGDAATDNVVFNADVNSNIVPNTNNAYDLGSSSQKWRNLFISGNANIGGTLTYEDVTNIDSIGIITARSNIDCNGNLDVSGTSSFGDNITVTSTDTGSSAAPEFKLFRNSASPADADYLGQIKFAGESDTGVERNYAKITGKILDASNGTEDGIIEFAHIKNGSQTITGRWRSDSLQLLNGTNLSVNGSVTATTFSGSGASLTNLPAANLTGTLPAISGANLTNLDASDLASGTIPDARFPAALPAIDGSALTGITASGTGAIGGLTIKNQSGAVVGTAGSVSTIDFDGSVGVTVTATTGAAGIATVLISADLVTDTSPQLGGNLDLNGNNITGSGNIPAANLTGTLPAISGANLTNLDASDLASGTVPDGRFPATLPASSGANLTNLNGSNISSGTVSAARVGALPASKITTGTFDAARIPTLNQDTTGTSALAEGLTGSPTIGVSTITTTGSVGIGSTLPTGKLDVIGQVNIKSTSTTTTSGIATSYTGSVQLDGNSDYLTVPGPGTLAASSNWTLECYFYCTGTSSGTYRIVSANESVNGSQYSLIRIRNGQYQFFTDNAYSSLVGTATFNEWHHIAFTKTGTTLRGFVDGVKILQTADNNSDTITTFVVGWGYGSEYFPGYISNVRFVNGTSLYKSNFTPQTAELTKIYNTTHLLAQSSSSATAEATGKTVTAVGTAAASTTNPSLEKGFNLTGSVDFDGNGDYLSINGSSDFNFGTGDFTIECFIKPDSLNTGAYTSSLSTIFDYDQNAGTAGAWFAMHQGNAGFNWGSNNNTQISSSSGLILGWNHIAVVRSGSTTTVYINGKSGGSATDNHNYTDSNTRELWIGKQQAGVNRQFNGYISNFRIVKGTAIYTAEFSPTFTELTELPNTKLLALQSASSATAYAVSPGAITAYGDATASSTSPGLISPNSVTGSVEFDGVNDYLTVGSHADLAMGTGDFTIEMWVYSTDSSLDTQDRRFFASEANGTSAIQFGHINTTGGIVEYATNGSLGIRVTGTTDIRNRWAHVAVVRQSNTVTLYIDGKSEGTPATDSNSKSASNLTIGKYPGLSGHFKGNMSNVRVIKGTALYTAAFTPSREELTNVTNTSLLALQSSSSATAEATGKTITATGAAASTTSPGLVKAYTNATGQTTTTTTTPGNLLVSGITTATNRIDIKSDDSTPGRIDFYCESSNAHYTQLRSAAHSAYSGIATVTLPTSTGTLLLTDGSGASLTNLPAANLTGTLPAISGANLTNLDASDLASGTVPDARFPATLPAASGANLTNLPAANITGTLPAISGANLTNLDASDLASGTIPDARFPATLPAISGANLTNINATIAGINTAGISTFNHLNVSGVSTFSSTVNVKNLTGSDAIKVFGTETTEVFVHANGDRIGDFNSDSGAQSDEVFSLVQGGNAADVEVASSRLKVKRTGGNVTAAFKTFTTIVGTTYTVTCDVEGIFNSGNPRVQVTDATDGGTAYTGTQLGVGNGNTNTRTSISFTFTATSTTSSLNLGISDYTREFYVYDLSITAPLEASKITLSSNGNASVAGIATVSTAFYLPQYTTTARDAGTFNEGAMIYNTTVKKMEFYDGTNWVTLPGVTLGLGMGVF